MIRYPAFIEPGSETTAFGVVIPDLPGCFSAGDTLEEALLAAQEAAAAWIDAALDSKMSIPSPSPAEKFVGRPEFKDWMLALIELDPALFDDKIERVNITLPRRVLRRLDDLAKAEGESRSGLIAKLTLSRGTALGDAN